MEIIRRDRLIEFAQRHPNARPLLDKSELQPFVEVLCNLIDFMKKDEKHRPTSLTEIEYQQLALRLDDLLDIVGEENHSLVPLLHLVGTLIKNYEDEHIPKLTEI